MRIHVITIFPDFFEEALRLSLLGRAREERLVEIQVHDLRDFAPGLHRQVDDYPYGGGGGMVLKPEPIFKAVESLGDRGEVIIPTARGTLFNQALAVGLSQLPVLTFIAGHYKGIDERVHHELADREISIGDYVLSGGEIPTLAIIDASVRLLPGVLGDFSAAFGDSLMDEPLLGAPVYTRPADFRGLTVPVVLLSGDHEAIEEWRREQSVRLTKERRPDLYRRWLEEWEETPARAPRE